jgi:aminoglycoside phosphotransferase
LLQQSHVAHYLVSLGLVNPLAVIEEDLTVTDVSRRNAVFVVTSSRGPVLVVKQAGSEDGRTVANEAAVLRSLAQVPALAGVVPELVHSDEAARRLVLRTPAAAIPWGWLPRPPRLAAGSLGRALAALHDSRLDVPAFTDDRLWVLTLPEPSYERVQDMSPAGLELLGHIQASRELCDRLRRLRDELVEDAFVHGDPRWDNWLKVGRSRSLLIDWELAGRGDAAADLGAALGEFLRLWVSSVPIADPSDPGRLVTKARFPLERVQPAMVALWEGYRRRRAVRLRRVSEFAGVRLLQSAFESALGLSKLPVEVMAMLQLGDNILRTPEHAAWALMGLRE